jgi:type II secretory pathway predicted ATPase ExeA
MAHVGLTKSLRHVDYFETAHHRQLLKDLKAAIHEGGIVAFTGVVGSGNTVLLWRIPDQLRPEGPIEVSESWVCDVPRLTLNTLQLARYDALATDQDGDLTGQPEKSARALLTVMQRCQKPSALCIDDGHDLHGQPRRSLKQCIDKTSHRGSRLTVVLAGHPRLTHELRRPSRAEIGARPTVFALEGLQGQQRRDITGLLERCAASVDPMDRVPPEALDLLAERRITPLPIQPYLTRVLEHADRVGEKPVTPALVYTTLAPDLQALEPPLTRYGYTMTALAELLNIRHAEVRAFLHGQLPPGRTEALHNHLVAAGIPLGDHLSLAHSELAPG